ncbi:hypothetical protein JYT31_02995 [Beggiatoa alba]|nr:hypothetical protein [Beggiatoa alba]
MTYLKKYTLLFSAFLMMACTPKDSLPPTDVFPVKWFPGFTMTQWLTKKPPMHDQHDVQALLDKPWGYPVKLINLQTQHVFRAEQCSEILSDINQLQPANESEIYAFAKQAAMCVAAESIANARPAEYSALSTFKLDADLPRHLPKNLALVISSSEWQRIVQNKEIVSWADVGTVKFVSKDSEYHAKYALVGAFQELSLIARGDFNADGTEDLLLHTMDYVVGGSYVTYRLFWITKINTNSPITLIREYPSDTQ